MEEPMDLGPIMHLIDAFLPRCDTEPEAERPLPQFLETAKFRPASDAEYSPAVDKQLRQDCSDQSLITRCGSSQRAKITGSQGRARRFACSASYAPDFLRNDV